MCQSFQPLWLEVGFLVTKHSIKYWAAFSRASTDTIHYLGVSYWMGQEAFTSPFLVHSLQKSSNSNQLGLGQECCLCISTRWAAVVVGGNLLWSLRNLSQSHISADALENHRALRYQITLYSIPGNVCLTAISSAPPPEPKKCWNPDAEAVRPFLSWPQIEMSLFTLFLATHNLSQNYFQFDLE